jgi:hypothetical protein
MLVPSAWVQISNFLLRQTPIPLPVLQFLLRTFSYTQLMSPLQVDPHTPSPHENCINIPGQSRESPKLGVEDASMFTVHLHNPSTGKIQTKI